MDGSIVRGAYFYDSQKVSEDNGLLCPEVTLTQQHEKDETDINVIVRRFGLTGKLPENMIPAMYGDFTGVTDFRTALEAVEMAQEKFMEMPAEVRARFDNDPQKFLEFTGALTPDGKALANLEEMRKLGLAVAAPAAEPAVPAQPIAGTVPG